MQQEAERSRLRGLTFQTLSNTQAFQDDQPQDQHTDNYEGLIQAAVLLESMGQTASALDMRKKRKQ